MSRKVCKWGGKRHLQAVGRDIVGSVATSLGRIIRNRSQWMRAAGQLGRRWVTPFLLTDGFQCAQQGQTAVLRRTFGAQLLTRSGTLSQNTQPILFLHFLLFRWFLDRTQLGRRFAPFHWRPVKIKEKKIVKLPRQQLPSAHYTKTLTDHLYVPDQSCNNFRELSYWQWTRSLEMWNFSQLCTSFCKMHWSFEEFLATFHYNLSFRGILFLSFLLRACNLNIWPTGHLKRFACALKIIAQGNMWLDLYL